MNDGSDLVGVAPLPEVHAFDDPLARLDAVATIELLDRGELTLAEVTDGVIRRARALEPHLGAVAFERYDAARRSLPESRRRGGFEGFPTFSKDMVPVAGLQLTWGSAALEGGPPQKRTKGIARDMERMGMVVVGSSTMPEWGFTSSTEFPHRGPTRNPWNPTRTVGGSSGGAAALVASGVVPIAHAADGGGSIRIPAACAGLVGLKPTLGRLRPHADEAKLPVAVTVDGVVTRSVRDTARWFAQMERVYRSRSLPPIGEVTGPPTRRLRVGVISSIPDLAVTDEPTAATVASAAALLEGFGHHIEETRIPFDVVRFRDDFITYFRFLVFLATRTARLTHGSHVRIDEITSFTRGMADDFRSDPRALPGAVRGLRAARRAYATVFDRYDLLLTPTLSHLPPELGLLSTAEDYEPLLGRMVPWIAFGPIANATGTPAISLPLGYDEATRLPIAAMLSAARGEDAVLLQAALELEEAQPWPLAKLR